MKVKREAGMRKIGILVASLLFVGTAYAAPTVIIDQDGQSMARVKNGKLAVNRCKEVETRYSISGSGYLYEGECFVQSVSMYAPTAGDFSTIYNDDQSNPQTNEDLEFELAIGTNTSIASIDAGGAYFNEGIYVHATDTDVLTTVVYDY